MPEANLPVIRAGFIALTDCAPIVVARELGLDLEEGIRIEPVRLPSWAAVRDQLAFEKLECAHMLGGLTLAMHLGLGGFRSEMMVPLLLGRGGNAITISVALYEEARALMKGRVIFDRAQSAAMLAAVVQARRAAGEAPLRLASVHAYSSHSYELRAWLAHGGVDPDQDVELSVVPPPKMVEALRAGQIDGYCVGEPWSQLAVEEGIGRIMATKADLYPYSPEKVLALRRSWATGHAETVSRLVAACVAAMRWAAQPANRNALADMLAGPDYLDTDREVILGGLMCAPRLVPGETRQPVADYLSFGGLDLGYPYAEAGLWLLAQMRRWGQAGAGHEEEVSAIFDTTIMDGIGRQDAGSRTNAGRRMAAMPFDGNAFDGGDVEGYWRRFPIRRGA
ncbi:CmpA/NrtA family ABC transporter substrate-binding protein [Gimibacter soli]|uniref:CmpA/NrtA family ABC transporter substrate-binding protein n=1 Tax=Gimibacter soli TaxID=3024400 RepID=A0AAE9XLR3_9PROT|nr:CmpA/NrtA family ABC transporter substrate-binding protein [Gimibacter soli]WCL53359.1 CmpA/NrtA family ABC transporter substrate-binding protein [Gimibacter soli]